MNEFFGIDMNYIMIALLAVLLVAVSTVLYVMVRNRVMFQIGVRNIPRRRAQTILIIVGLMLSTLIISTALSIGDTVDYSVTSQTYNELQSTDEIVALRSDDTPTDGAPSSDSNSDTEVNVGLVSAVPIPEEESSRLIAQFLKTEGVDGAIPLFRGVGSAINEPKGQSEPLVLAVGLPDDMPGFSGDLQTKKGEKVTIADLGPDEMYAGATAAKKLDITAGDKITLYAQGEPHELTVKAVLKDQLLTGSFLGQTFGFTMRLDRAQEIFGRPDDIDMILVSNDGGMRSGVAPSDAVAKRLNETLKDTPFGAQTIKKDLVEQADLIASVLTTFFVVLGLFSIAAGMLLIFLIFVMLAAERKAEMGMIRAVGTKRSHLVQMFVSEGMVYNMVSAAIGCALGIVVSIAMVGLMARLFADFGLQITFHMTVRSLVISYSVGVVLTFLTVVFSSWRIGNLNIVSAIRDSPDPIMVKERPTGGRGIGRVIRYVAWVLFKPETWGQFFRGLALVPVGGLLGGLGYGLFIAAAAVYGSGTAGGALGVLFGVLGGFLIAGGAAAVLIGLSSIFQFGPLMLLAGPPLMLFGWDTKEAFPFGGGLSLMIVGAALLVRFLGAPARPVFTAMGLVMLFFWLLFAGNNVPGVSELNGDIEMFFLSGVTMVIAGTFVLVYNADLMLGGLTLLGGRFSSLLPSIRTAVAYPLANKFRTGMTIAMISLVMFALVMMSTMNSNFDRIFLSDDALAGYDVLVTENPGNPIDDLGAALTAGGFASDGIAGIDTLDVANQTVSNFREVDAEAGELATENYPILGMSREFMQNNKFTLQARATGFDSDQAVLDALSTNPDYAVIDAFSTGGGGFGDGGVIQGIKPTDRTFDPVSVDILDSTTSKTHRVQIIGVLSTTASGLFTGLFVPQETFDDVYPNPESTLSYVRLNPGVNANDTAKAIEKTLLAQGAQADSLRQLVSDFQAQSRGFLYLLQGFMGIGLFVGIAAVGVIAFRTVVERRQQIGMLRAIGYTRRAVALSFLMESSFTALLGILSGITLGLLLANQLVKTDDFVAGGVTSFYIPWVQILAIGGFAFVASFIMTIIPSRQASGIPIAEALRYE